MSAMTAILLVNAALFGLAWPYVAIVMVQLVNAFASFVRLLLSVTIREDRAA